MTDDEPTRVSAPVGPNGEALPASVGKYRIDGLIGRGAFGIVYKGFDPHICRPVAIKSLRSEVLAEVDDQASLLARFAVEARSAGRCHHPNIVTVFDYVEQDDAPFIIMEFVQAGTLQDVTRTRTMLPLSQLADVMGQLLSALGHAHEKGVIHRDIKPANVLCPSPTVIKVTDFGVARFQSLGLTQDGGAIGTPGYMSPEQLLGRDVDERCDLFAAGVLLYQLITGKTPFPANDIPALLQKLLHEKPTPMRELRPEVPSALEDVVARALEQNAKDRFQTADEFKRSLEDALKEALANPEKPIDVTQISTVVDQAAREMPSGPLNATMADMLSADTMHKLEESLARSIGPIARVLLAREARGATDPQRLIAALQQQIPSGEEAERFRQSAEAFMRADGSLDRAGIAAAAAAAINEHAPSTEIPEAARKIAIELLKPIIGPVSRIVVEREAAAAHDVNDFLRRVGSKIDDADEREWFVATCRKQM